MEKTGIKALPKSFKFSKQMLNTIGRLMSSKKSLKIDQDQKTGGASINGVTVLILGGNSWKIGGNIYEITPEIHKANSSTFYTGESMKIENDILILNIILRDVKNTGVGDRTSNRKNYLWNFPKQLTKFKTKLSMKLI